MCIPSQIRPGVIINPASGANRRRPVQAQRLSSMFGVPVRETVTPAEVSSALEYFSAGNVNVVVVSGGDGTVQAVHTALFAHEPFNILPPLVVARAGTANMTAGDIGVRDSLPDILRKITGETETCNMRLATRDILKLNIPGQGTFCGMFFTTAGICDVMIYFHERLHGRGLLGLPGIILVFLKFLSASLAEKGSFGMGSKRIELELGNAPAITEDFMIFMVTTLHRLVFGIKPFRREQGRGPLRLSALTRHPQKLWRELPGIVRGRPSSRVVRKNGYWLAATDMIKLKLQGTVALDGEMYDIEPEPGYVTIEHAGNCPFIKW